MNSKEIIEKYVSLLMIGDLKTLQTLFYGQPNINTPIEGEISGKIAFKNYVSKRKDWLNTKNAKPELFNYISSDDRIVAEFIVYFEKEGKTIDLPVVLVADLEYDLVSKIRTYYSSWPLLGKHIGRKPMLKPVEYLDEPDIIQSYMEGLMKADKDLVLSLFEKDAYVREPSGSLYKHEGEFGRKEFYSSALGSGGIPLKHCTATYDGKSFAVEYLIAQRSVAL